MANQNINPHLRIFIRRKLKSVLEPRLNLGKDRLFLSRPNVVFKKYCPCGLIYFDEQLHDTENKKPRQYLNNLFVNIEFLTRFSLDFPPDDWLDSRAFEVEQVIGEDRYIGLDFVEDIILARTVCTSIEDEGEENIESLKIMLNIKFRDKLLYVGSRPDEFLRFIAQYEVNEGVTAEDNVTIRDK